MRSQFLSHIENGNYSPRVSKKTKKKQQQLFTHLLTVLSTWNVFFEHGPRGSAIRYTLDRDTRNVVGSVHCAPISFELDDVR